MLHAFKRAPHPFPNPIDTTRVFPPDTSLLFVEGFTPNDFTTGVEILNDNTTPMEFVIKMLEQHLQLKRENSIRLMLEIHNNGGALVPVVGQDKADAIAAALTKDARENGHKLICRAIDIDAPRSARGTASV